MIQCIFIAKNLDAKYGGSELIKEWQKDDNGLLWLDINEHDSDQEHLILEQLGCHPLAIEDAVRDNRHPPKIELFDNYIFMIYREIFSTKSQLEFELLPIGLFVGKRILITRHDKKSETINNLFNNEGEKLLKTSPMTLALRIFHYSSGAYIEALLQFEDTLEAIEDAFQIQGSDQMMQKLTLYSSRLTKLKRTFNYHLNIGSELKSLIGDGTTIIGKAESHYLTDMQERLQRLLSLSQMYYDICGDIINAYISITSHQLNETMQALTVITAIFVPLSFLAGIYGMNFSYMPELKAQYGYFYLLGIMAIIALGLVIFFKKKRWL
ncbi:magnesium transporter CorA family protein [Psychromonas sp. MME2]|uniref:magnesium transporter CorA family protein n=1 Tax=unclassified Psychromonas TaxID=2614957 RepID=UPI00339C8D38